MPKKINYEDELKSLRGLPDHALRPVSTRVPVSCFRALCETCNREGTDLSVLVRNILEEQAPLHVAGHARVGKAALPSDVSGEGMRVLLPLSAELAELAFSASAGLGIDLLALLQMAVAEALPGWVVRANKARQQRRDVMKASASAVPPERAAWDAYSRVAPARNREPFQRIDELVQAGMAQLELDADAILRLVVVWDDPTIPEGMQALRKLIRQRVLVCDEPAEPTVGANCKLRLVPEAPVEPPSS